MRRSSSSGILYAEDFDAPELPIIARIAQPAPDPVILEPTFSLADLHRAAEQADREARLQERREAADASSVRSSDALMRIADELARIRSDAAQLAVAAASSTAETLLAMVAAVLPAFSATRGKQEASALLHLLLPAMTHQSHLAIRVHPSLIDSLRDELSPVLEGGQATVEWLASSSMTPGDLNVRWRDGMMIRDGEALCKKVQALVMPEAPQAEATVEIHDGK